MSENLGRRKMDYMSPDGNDHDLLVRLDTKVTVLIEQQTNFIRSSNEINKELAERIARLEVKDRGDSEKFQAISVEVQRSLNNSQRIAEQQIEITTLKDELKSLRSKANLFDSINAAGVVVTGIIGYIFGSR
jgi:hypothetical protein